jgi:D-3-phosphoglycerate dehydrogenase / 2-oxoglutarate reductase
MPQDRGTSVNASLAPSVRYGRQGPRKDGERPLASFRVVVTDPLVPDIEVEREVIEAAGGQVEVASSEREPVLDLARAADALLVTYYVLDRPAIEQLERCRIIARYGIGVDNIDLEATQQRGIAVTNVPDYCVEEVASQALGLIIALVRHFKPADALVTGGGWGASKLGEVHRLSRLTVGVVGYGRIARLLAQMLAPFGCAVLVADPYVKAVGPGLQLVSLTELLERSDVVSLHCPLTEETKGMIDTAALTKMRDGAVLVNVARGGLVVTDAVLAALKSGKLSGAGLDTFDIEPPDATKWRGVPNLITTPHSAFYSLEAIDESRRKAATQIVKLFRGEALDYEVH